MNSTSRPNEEMVIVASADSQAVMPLATMLYTAARHYAGPYDVKLYILGTGTTAAERDRVNRVLRGFSWAPIWLLPDLRPLGELPISGHISPATYFRLLIPELLPQYDKALYLDADMLVLGDLTELWATDVSDYPVFAVQDEHAPVVSSRHGLINYRELGIPEDRAYFNSGVLLLNLEAWRREEIALRVADYLLANREAARWWDQDGLNVILADRWGRLDARWNRFGSMLPPSAMDELTPPAIVHYAGWRKPWTRHYRHSSRELFDRFLRESGWFGWGGWYRYHTKLAMQRGTFRLARTLIPRQHLNRFKRLLKRG